MTIRKANVNTSMNTINFKLFNKISNEYDKYFDEIKEKCYFKNIELLR